MEHCIWSLQTQTTARTTSPAAAVPTSSRNASVSGVRNGRRNESTSTVTTARATKTAVAATQPAKSMQTTIPAKIIDPNDDATNDYGERSKRREEMKSVLSKECNIEVAECQFPECDKKSNPVVGFCQNVCGNLCLEYSTMHEKNPIYQEIHEFNWLSMDSRHLLMEYRRMEEEERIKGSNEEKTKKESKKMDVDEKKSKKREEEGKPEKAAAVELTKTSQPTTCKHLLAAVAECTACKMIICGNCGVDHINQGHVIQWYTAKKLRSTYGPVDKSNKEVEEKEEKSMTGELTEEHKIPVIGEGTTQFGSLKMAFAHRAYSSNGPSGQAGRGLTELHSPQGMTSTRDGSIFIADRDNNRVGKLPIDNSPMQFSDDKKCSSAEPGSPRVVVAFSGGIAVIDQSNTTLNRVTIFDDMGSMERRLLQTSSMKEIKEVWDSSSTPESSWIAVIDEASRIFQIDVTKSKAKILSTMTLPEGIIPSALTCTNDCYWVADFRGHSVCTASPSTESSFDPSGALASLHTLVESIAEGKDKLFIAVGEKQLCIQVYGSDGAHGHRYDSNFPVDSISMKGGLCVSGHYAVLLSQKSHAVLFMRSSSTPN